MKQTAGVVKPIIETNNLSLYYCGKPALKSISLAVMPNAVTTIVGPSGCGKTSLLTTLNRLSDMVACCHVTGRVVFDGMDILHKKTDLLELRRRVGQIFQKPNPFPLSIRRNIELPLREHGLKNRQEIANIMETALQNVGLWQEVKDRLESPALALSGGQQQRLCIARAIAIKPEVLLMDEPCSSLDPISSGVIEELILELKKSYSLLVVTHNLPQAKRIADYCSMFWLQDGAGCQVEYAEAGQFFANPQSPITASYIDGRHG